MKCPHCGQEIPDLSKICSYCRRIVDKSNDAEIPLTKTCNTCGTVNSIASVFCSKCGGNLNQTQTERPERTYVPPQAPSRTSPAPGLSGWGLIEKVLIGVGALVVLFVLFIVVAAFAFGASGTDHAPSTAVSVSGAAATTIVSAPTTRANSASTADFSQVTHLSASTIPAHWSSGANYDGITIHPALRDNADTTVTWSEATLPVDIQIYTTKFDNNYKEVKDKLVFQGTGQITSWTEGNMFMGGGIRVPYSSMQVPAGVQYGWAIITVHTPDGKTYADTDKFTSLSP